MASCKLWSRKDRLKQALEYDSNPEKTFNAEYDNELIRMELKGESILYNKKYLVTAVNCCDDEIYERMKELLSYNPTGKTLRNVAYRAEQSFKAGEVPPRIAHEIGVKLAQNLWSNFVVQVATHTNTDHVHNHFTICATGLNGKRFYNNGKAKWLMREESDKLCREYGLSIIKLNPKRYRYQNYGEWKAAKESGNLNTYRGQLRYDIDRSIECSINEKEFYHNMKMLGYTITLRGKYVSVIADDHERAIRLSPKLGDGYSIEDIMKRIYEGERVKPKMKPYWRSPGFHPDPAKLPVKSFPKAARGWIGMYYHYCYLLGAFPEKKPDQPQKWIPPKLRGDLEKVQRLADELAILVPNHICTSDDMKKYTTILEKKLETVMSERDDLRRVQKRRTLTSSQKADLSLQIADKTKTIKSIRYKLKLCADLIENTDRRRQALNEELEHESTFLKQNPRLQSAKAEITIRNNVSV